MIVDFKYRGQSAVVQGLNSAKMAFATNALREAAYFKGTLGRPLLLREALASLYAVVTSDLKFRPRDRFAFEAWLAEQDRLFLEKLGARTEKARLRIEELEARRSELDARKQKRLEPFYQARKHYFEYVFHHEYELNYILDPVITVHPDEVFFEAFSQDESSYARVGARYDLFDRIEAFECGTTNIDFSARLARELDRIRTYRKTEFDIAPAGLAVAVGGGEAHKEKKVALPETWVEGFLQVQSTMTMGLTHLRIAPIDLFNVCRYLRLHKAKKSPRALRFELVPGKRIRVVFEPWEHAIELSATAVYSGDKPQSIRTWGRDRLRVLSRLLPVVQHVDVFLAGFGLPSIYVLDLGEVSFTLALSGWTENDWSGGAKFDLLTRRVSATPEELMLVYESLRQVRHADEAQIALTTKLGIEKTRSVLSHLCQVGRAMYDLSVRRYRHRDLFADPFTLKEAVKAVAPNVSESTPEAKAAQAIFAGDDVRIIMRRPFSGGFKLSGSARGESGGRVRPLLTVDHEGRIVEGTCTCARWKSQGLTMGPCEHLLALRLAHMARLTDEDGNGNETKGGN